MTDPYSIESLRQRSNDKIDTALAKHCNTIDNVSPQLIEAITYSIRNGGKRIRPLLVYASTRTIGGELSLADSVAVAIEMIHTYSLIHDDLPSMDDDNLRRGQPSCHIEHGEALAILAGDALQALAFSELVTTLHTRDSEQRFSILNIISNASIAMVSGQALDICSADQVIDKGTLQTMYINKTGALISASVQVGGYCSDKIIDAEQHELLRRVGDQLGLAFQIQDDLLDLETDTEYLGKPRGSDATRNKPTYPAIIGTDASTQLVNNLHDQVMHLLPSLQGDYSSLKQMCELLGTRQH